MQLSDNLNEFQINKSLKCEYLLGPQLEYNVTQNGDRKGLIELLKLCVQHDCRFSKAIPKGIIFVIAFRQSRNKLWPNNNLSILF